jgi:hypothetical protein
MEQKGQCAEEKQAGEGATGWEREFQAENSKCKDPQVEMY